MYYTYFSHTTSRRDLAGSLRGSRPRKHARLRHRRLQAERLEDRQMLATISGAVFNDLNANGLKDGGEAGQSGWTVYLDADGNGQRGTGEISATTDGVGNYSFIGLATGTYTVAEDQKPGWQQTSPLGATPPIERVSVTDDGTDNFASYSISADGRYVAFQSVASNLVEDDTNGLVDVFVYDRRTDSIERVSVATDGTEGNGKSFTPAISADGRYVAFTSRATNLVPGDTNATDDVFVYDRQTPHTIERVSVASNGTQGNNYSLVSSLSADGRYVAFWSLATNFVSGDTNATYDVFVYDRQTDTIEQVSVAADGTRGNSYSMGGWLSADGRYVALYSAASNLVPGDTNGAGDTFVYDRQTDTIRRVSLAADGTQGNGKSESPARISGDGRYVAFYSKATNLVPGDTNGIRDAFFAANPFASGSHEVVLIAGQDATGINFGNASLTTKFYVVNDASLDRTYEYNATGTSVETYGLNTSNTAPRGAASTIAGDKTWVVDANRKVYVYDNSGGLVGSWSLGSLNWAADVQGIATNGTDVWVVDAYSDKVYKYTNAANRTSGSQNAASSFNLNNSNKNAADIVTDGTSLWVVNNSTTDKVFKYTTGGALISSWTITTAGATSPTGITIDPANVSHIWIVDSGTDRVYQYNAAATFANGSSHAADVAFALAVGNTNPQGIADPPAPGSELSANSVVVRHDEITPMVLAAVWDASVMTRASLGSTTATRASVAQRVATTTPRGVDELMNSLGSAVDLIQRDVHVACTMYANTRRPTHNVDCELLADELDTTIGLIADDLVATSPSRC